jgi:hypothetical protein
VSTGALHLTPDSGLRITLIMNKGLLLISAGMAVACASARPAAIPNRSLTISSVACDDASAAATARQAFDRAKEALGRVPGVESVSIGECDVFWAGHFLSIHRSEHDGSRTGGTHTRVWCAHHVRG